MPKIDLYRNVHMGQRARLFTLAVELGAADISHSAAAAEHADSLPRHDTGTARARRP